MYEYILEKIKYKNLFLFFFTFFTVIFASIVSKDTNNGLLPITISLIPLVQVMTKLIEMEEIKEEKLEENLLVRHKNFILSYFSIFFGAVFGFYISFLLFPNIFNIQVKSIIELKNEILMIGKYLEKEAFFSYILLNNLKLLILSFLFSFIFGAGAIYLLLWNASIVGIFLGLEAKEANKSFLFKYGLYPLYKLFLILPHGIFEFSAYFLAALSGGILSIALIKFPRKKILERIIIDSILLFVFSIIILIFAAFIEAFM